MTTGAEQSGMLSEKATSPDSPDRSSGLNRRGWIHFGLAAGVLLIAATGWNVAMVRWKWALAKMPVPRGEHLEVQEFRLMNFPDKLGPYVMVGDGSVILPEDLLDSLGTKAHSENWYCMKKYRIPDPSRFDGAQYVSLDITYYTGLLDAIPHIPEVCMVAGGAVVDTSENAQIDITVPGAPESWRNVKVRRVTFIKNSRKFRQYYLFSMNGTPVTDWKVIRGKFMLPWVRYCFFAKIQIGALSSQDDVSISDKLCRDFLTHALPAVLKFLPTAEYVKKLEQGHGS